MQELISKYRIDRISLLKMDIEGGEFAVLAVDEELRWLAQVDQVALEIHPDHGDATAVIARLRNHGFTVDLRDNDGGPAAVTSNHLAYAYCQR
jgi:hypothetical protein